MILGYLLYYSHIPTRINSTKLAVRFSYDHSSLEHIFYALGNARILIQYLLWSIYMEPTFANNNNQFRIFVSAIVNAIRLTTTQHFSSILEIAFPAND